MLFQLILAVLMSATPHYTDTESPELRRVRMVPVAHAVAAAAQQATCAAHWNVRGCRRIWPGSTENAAAALLALGWHETRWAQYVGRGRCLDGPKGSRCDPDPKTGLPRARGYWQLWRVAARDAWALPVGTPNALRAEAWAAMRRLAGARARCVKRALTPLTGAFSGYAGRRCRWMPAKVRATYTARIERKLWRR